MRQHAAAKKLKPHLLTSPKNKNPPPADVDAALRDNAKIRMVAVVHCETTTGILNPIEEIGKVVAAHKRLYFVYAMSIALLLTLPGARLIISCRLLTNVLKEYPASHLPSPATPR